jgi:hypothetical protein
LQGHIVIFLRNIPLAADWSGNEFQEWFALGGTITASQLDGGVRVELRAIQLSTSPDQLELAKYSDPIDGTIEGPLDVACMVREASAGAPTAPGGAVAEPVAQWNLDTNWTSAFCQHIKAIEQLPASAGGKP